jgi:hypothetical protein
MFDIEKDFYGSFSRILCGTVPGRVQTGDCKGENAEISAQDQRQAQSAEKYARITGKRGDDCTVS